MGPGGLLKLQFQVANEINPLIASLNPVFPLVERGVEEIQYGYELAIRLPNKSYGVLRLLQKDTLHPFVLRKHILPPLLRLAGDTIIILGMRTEEELNSDDGICEEFFKAQTNKGLLKPLIAYTAGYDLDAIERGPLDLEETRMALFDMGRLAAAMRESLQVNSPTQLTGRSR